MKTQYPVVVTELTEIFDRPGAWTEPDYRAVLNNLDYPDADSISTDDLFDMLLLAMEERGIEDAGSAVFGYKVKDKMTAGQIHNAIHELQDEDMWNSYREVNLHMLIFDVAWLMHRAFRGTYGKPSCLQTRLTVSGPVPAQQNLAKTMNKTSLLQLIASGMPDDFVIKRMYSPQLKSGNFADSDGIIWAFSTQQTGESLEINVLSNTFWLAELGTIESFTATL